MRQLLVVPVFNEAALAPEVVPEIHRHLPAEIEQVIFIDDASADGTGTALDEACLGLAGFSVIHRPVNRGYGAAMIDALSLGRSGGFDFVITMDCDKQHQPSDLRRFARWDPRIDVVSGSRYLPESGAGGIPPPPDRVEINRRLTARINRRYGYTITDAFCGFKRYRIATIDPTFFRVEGYAFPMEFWAYAHNRQLSIAEIPVTRIYVTDDRSFGQDLDRRRARYRYYLETWAAAERRLAEAAT